MRVIPPRFFSILLLGGLLQLLLLSIASVFFFLPESDAALWSALHARPPYVSMASLKLFTECKKKKKKKNIVAKVAATSAFSLTPFAPSQDLRVGSLAHAPQFLEPGCSDSAERKPNWRLPVLSRCFC